ncbi:MAG: hypothetical protein KGO51_04935 [Alphaproteobacteria bacterium]|nr:hypothetical protein [Alphaproteobacteria bacterium]
MRTPADLIREAEDAEVRARAATAGAERSWLLAKAAELRHQADRAEQLARRDGAPRRDR